MSIATEACGGWGRQLKLPVAAPRRPAALADAGRTAPSSGARCRPQGVSLRKHIATGEAQT